MPEIEITINAEVAAAKAELEKLRDTVAEFEKGIENTEESNFSFADSFTELQSKIATVQQVIAGLKQVYDATVGKFLEYGAQVRDITAATGLQTEEVSRMMEATDDAGISYGTLKMALREMGKDGVAPTIDELANLADEFKLIQDPAEKTKFLMESFGRSGMEMGKLMEQSGDSIRATAAVMDDEMAKSAEEMRKAVDALDDSVRNLTLEITAGFIPGLTKAATAAATLISWQGQLDSAVVQHEKDVLKTSKSYTVYYDEMLRVYKLMGSEYLQTHKIATQAEYDLAQGTDESTRALGRALSASKEYVDQVGLETEAAQDAAQATEELARNLEGMGKQYLANIPLTEDAAEAIRNHAADVWQAIGKQELYRQELEKTAETQQANALLEIGLKGKLTGAEEDYYKAQKDLAGEIEKTELALASTSVKKLEKIDELNARLEEQKSRVKENADAHEEATRRIVLGYLQQALAAQGIDPSVLMQLAENWGLIDKGATAAYKAVKEAATQYANDKDSKALETNANNAITAMQNMAAIMSDEVMPIVISNMSMAATSPEAAAWLQKQQDIKDGYINIKDTVVEKTPEIVTTFKTGQQAAEDYARAASDLAWQIRNIPDKKTITITTVYHSVHNEDEGIALGMAGAVP